MEWRTWITDGSYSASDIQEKHGENTDNLSIRIYINKIESRLK